MPEDVSLPSPTIRSLQHSWPGRGYQPVSSIFMSDYRQVPSVELISACCILLAWRVGIDGPLKSSLHLILFGHLRPENKGAITYLESFVSG